ncbi:MAG: glycosyltransferase [Planctomycetota bacterium]|nr:MAG: glycosyltransferase [Planctomycetota bacterium]
MASNALPTENILGYDVTTIPRKQFTDSICKEYENFNNVCVYTINPHSYVTSLHDKKFNSALKDSEFLVPDGTGFVLASILLGGQISKRITGNDLFMEISENLNKRGIKYAFFGTHKSTLDIITNKLRTDFPNIEVVKSISPPFRKFTEEENIQFCKEINESGTEVLWVGMTAPKQEKWIYENLHRLNVNMILPIGAVFDFYAGTVKRPGPMWCKLGMEWLPRFLKHPIKLWRRNVISSPIFLVILCYTKCVQLLTRNKPSPYSSKVISTEKTSESNRLKQINSE